MPEQLAARLLRTSSLLSSVHALEAVGGEDLICAELAAQVDACDEVVRALLEGKVEADACAQALLGGIGNLAVTRLAQLVLDLQGEADAFHYVSGLAATRARFRDWRGNAVWSRVKEVLQARSGRGMEAS